MIRQPVNAGVRTRFALSCSVKNCEALGLQAGEVLNSGNRCVCGLYFEGFVSHLPIDWESTFQQPAQFGIALKKTFSSRSTHQACEGRPAPLTPHNVPRILRDVSCAGRSCNYRLNPTPVSFTLIGNYILVRSYAPNSLNFSNSIIVGFRSANLRNAVCPVPHVA